MRCMEGPDGGSKKFPRIGCVESLSLSDPPLRLGNVRQLDKWAEMAEDSEAEVIREFDATKAIVASDTGGAMSLVHSGATTQSVVKTMAKLVFPCQGTCALDSRWVS